MKLADFDFRIWDKGEENLTYASKDWKLSIGFSNPQQDNGEVESVLHAYYDGEPQCPDDCEIELWSGFYDSKGKKIYENDIVRAISGALFIVGIDEDIKNWIVTNTLCQGINSQALIQLIDHTEVVGNIHENADLLNARILKDKE